MHIQQRLWSSAEGWKEVDRRGGETISQGAYELVFAFGERKELENPERFNELRDFYPKARVITCSTARMVKYSHFFTLPAVSFTTKRLRYFLNDGKNSHY